MLTDLFGFADKTYVFFLIITGEWVLIDLLGFAHETYVFFSDDYRGMGVDWFAWIHLIVGSKIWWRPLDVFVLHKFLLIGLN